MLRYFAGRLLTHFLRFLAVTVLIFALFSLWPNYSIMMMG